MHCATFTNVHRDLTVKEFVLPTEGPPEPGAPCHGISGILVNPALISVCKCYSRLLLHRHSTGSSGGGGGSSSSSTSGSSSSSSGGDGGCSSSSARCLCDRSRVLEWTTSPARNDNTLLIITVR